MQNDPKDLKSLSNATGTRVIEGAKNVFIAALYGTEEPTEAMLATSLAYAQLARKAGEYNSPGISTDDCEAVAMKMLHDAFTALKGEMPDSIKRTPIGFGDLAVAPKGDN